MSWELHSNGPEKFELVLSDEPSYIYALQMAPEFRETELEFGRWLIVAFPIWSGPVRSSVHAAVACAKSHDGKFQLGIRPYNSYEEIHKWWPFKEVPAEGNVLVTVSDEGPRREIKISTDPASNPLWLVLRDGQVIYQGAGPRSKEQLAQLMQTVLL